MSRIISWIPPRYRAGVVLVSLLVVAATIVRVLVWRRNRHALRNRSAISPQPPLRRHTRHDHYTQAPQRDQEAELFSAQPVTSAPAESHARHSVDAMFDGKVFRPLTVPDFPPGTQVAHMVPARVTVTGYPPAPAGERTAEPGDEGDRGEEDGGARTGETTPGLQRIRQKLRKPLVRSGLLSLFTRLDMLLLLGAMLIYGITRFVGLVQFPIFFFCDEAIQTRLAEKLINNGLRDEAGTFLPPYFLNVKKWNLGFSIYLHAITTFLFGKSVFLTRATSVVVGMLAPAAIALTLKVVFNNRFWWMAPLVLGIVPAWFLHSRTAFETVMTVAFFACFLCSYLLYRTRSPLYVFATLIFGAATFYSYSNGQGIMAVCSVLLLLFGLPYHIRQIRQRPLVMIAGLLLIFLLAVPLLRHRSLHPGETSHQLEDLGSYWVESIPTGEKISRFAENYLSGLDPRYWFLYNDVDLVRHRMQDMGHLPLIIAPFVAIGLGVCLWRWRSPPHRTMLVAVLAVPFSPALVRIEVYRVLGMVVPATLLAVIGFAQLYAWLTQAWLTRWAWLNRLRPYMAVAAGTAATLVVLNIGLLHSALTHGPTWYTNYGMGGMQYGARQIFEQTVPVVLAATPPNTQIVVSHTWANFPNVFMEFFLTPQQRKRVGMISIKDILQRIASDRVPLPQEKLFVLPHYEYREAVNNNKLIVSSPEQIIPYPDGRPGFYFVRMRYVDNVDEIVLEERKARQQLVESQVTLEGEPLTLRHSLIDMGNPQNIFDGDTETLLRGREANPFIVEFHFPSPHTIATLGVQVRCKDFSFDITVTPPGGGEAQAYTTTYRDMPVDSRVDYAFPDGPVEADMLRLEITNLNGNTFEHIHLWEVEFQ
jgi:hypothetical protein